MILEILSSTEASTPPMDASFTCGRQRKQRRGWVRTRGGAGPREQPPKLKVNRPTDRQAAGRGSFPPVPAASPPAHPHLGAVLLAAAQGGGHVGGAGVVQLVVHKGGAPAGGPGGKSGRGAGGLGRRQWVQHLSIVRPSTAAAAAAAAPEPGANALSAAPCPALQAPLTWAGTGRRRAGRGRAAPRQRRRRAARGPGQSGR